MSDLSHVGTLYYSSGDPDDGIHAPNPARIERVPRDGPVGLDPRFLFKLLGDGDVDEDEDEQSSADGGVVTGPPPPPSPPREERQAAPHRPRSVPPRERPDPLDGGPGERARSVPRAGSVASVDEPTAKFQRIEFVTFAFDGRGPQEGMWEDAEVIASARWERVERYPDLVSRLQTWLRDETPGMVGIYFLYCLFRGRHCYFDQTNYTHLPGSATIRLVRASTTLHTVGYTPRSIHEYRIEPALPSIFVDPARPPVTNDLPRPAIAWPFLRTDLRVLPSLQRSRSVDLDAFDEDELPPGPPRVDGRQVVARIDHWKKRYNPYFRRNEIRATSEQPATREQARARHALDERRREPSPLEMDWDNAIQPGHPWPHSQEWSVCTRPLPVSDPWSADGADRQAIVVMQLQGLRAAVTIPLTYDEAVYHVRRVMPPVVRAFDGLDFAVAVNGELRVLSWDEFGHGLPPTIYVQLRPREDVFVQDPSAWGRMDTEREVDWKQYWPGAIWDRESSGAATPPWERAESQAALDLGRWLQSGEAQWEDSPSRRTEKPAPPVDKEKQDAWMAGFDVEQGLLALRNLSCFDNDGLLDGTKEFVAAMYAPAERPRASASPSVPDDGTRGHAQGIPPHSPGDENERDSPRVDPKSRETGSPEPADDRPPPGAKRRQHQRTDSSRSSGRRQTKRNRVNVPSRSPPWPTSATADPTVSAPTASVAERRASQAVAGTEATGASVLCKLSKSPAPPTPPRVIPQVASPGEAGLCSPPAPDVHSPRSAAAAADARSEASAGTTSEGEVKVKTDIVDDRQDTPPPRYSVLTVTELTPANLELVETERNPNFDPYNADLVSTCGASSSSAGQDADDLDPGVRTTWRLPANKTLLAYAEEAVPEADGAGRVLPLVDDFARAFRGSAQPEQTGWGSAAQPAAYPPWRDTRQCHPPSRLVRFVNLTDFFLPSCGNAYFHRDIRDGFFLVGPVELSDGTDIRLFIEENILERHQRACLRCAQARWGGYTGTPAKTGSTRKTFECLWAIQLAVDGRMLTQADAVASARLGYGPIDFQVFARPLESIPPGQISLDCGWRLAAAPGAWVPAQEREWAPLDEVAPGTQPSSEQDSRTHAGHRGGRG